MVEKPKSEIKEEMMMEAQNFEVRIIRGINDKPEVIACKQPTPSMGVSFDLTVRNIGEKEVEIKGNMKHIK